MILSVWPSAFCAAGVVALLAYNSLAPDHNLYKSEGKSHVFWHALYAGLVSASPQLTKIYSYGEEPYSDSISYQAALADIRARNDRESPIAYVQDGTILINPMVNMGAYDHVMRSVFFKTIAKHPFLAIKSFLIDKPRDQGYILDRMNLFKWPRYYVVVLMVLVVSVVAIAAGASFPSREELIKGTRVAFLIAPFSMITTLIVPSALIVGTIVFWMMLLFILCIYLPIAGLATAALLHSKK
jgi:hypothetical protein